MSRVLLDVAKKPAGVYIESVLRQLNADGSTLAQPECVEFFSELRKRACMVWSQRTCQCVARAVTAAITSPPQLTYIRDTTSARRLSVRMLS